MNPRYAQILKSLKVSYPLQMPPYEQQIMPQAKQQLKAMAQKIGELNKKQAEMISALQPISKNTQLQNMPENIQKKHDLNFLKTLIAINIDSYYRIKRFLMIYHNTRLNKIEDHYWYYSGNLKEQNKANLAEIQKQYFNEYKTIATEYMEEVGLELTTDIDPPVDASVEVLFLKDCGEILSDDGEPIKLEKNAAMYIKRRLVQNFIKDGSAQLISSNSN